MFKWLEQEIADIKTPRFHLIDGPADQTLRDAVIRSTIPLHESYKEFVLRFGNAKLYRNPRNDSYRVGVFASPKEATLNDGSHIYHLGFHDGASVYVKPAFESNALPIFEFESGYEEKVADDFIEWLKNSCADARNAYGKKEWLNILHGPEPFSSEEIKLIETRRQFHWRVLGVNVKGKHIFEVTNTGHSTLHALTVGVRSKDRRLNGAIRLNVENVGPGQTCVLYADCYKDLMPPEEIEPFVLPDPQPEDRSMYWEFRAKREGNQ